MTEVHCRARQNRDCAHPDLLCHAGCANVVGPIGYSPWPDHRLLPDRSRCTSAWWRCPSRGLHARRRLRRVERSRAGGPGGPRATRQFCVEIVGEAPGALAAGQRRADRGAARDRHRRDERYRDRAVGASVHSEGWRKGRYPRLVGWLQRMHARGALLCSACSGIFLLAETGLWDGKDATVHFGYARAFADLFPAVAIHPERVLVIAGLREELICSGASTTWHDLVLYLTARHAGANTAQAVARMFALQWHQDGLAPYMVFEGRSDHGDAHILSAQQWLAKHFSVARPVEEMIKRSKARRAHLQAALRQRDRTDTDRLCAAAARRGREAPARAHRCGDRRDQLARRVRRRRPFSAACSGAPRAWRRVRTASAFRFRTSHAHSGAAAPCGSTRWGLQSNGASRVFTAC